ncbi:MAG: hypothetical protein HY866_04705 [Chloroflexi bacterium]|nr:hypothetical protein [Chloroflexota bacterium]
MPVDVKRLDGEPIIYAQFSGNVDEQDVLHMFQKSQELAQDISGRVYRITETNNIEVSFEELMRIIKRMAARNIAGATADPRFKAVLVGTQEETQFLSENAQKGGMDVPLFESLDQALGYLRWQIQTEN